MWHISRIEYPSELEILVDWEKMLSEYANTFIEIAAINLLKGTLIFWK